MVEHVKRLKRELVYKGAILDIYKDTMELPDGNKAEWDFVSHRMGAAAILPVMKDGRIVMVRQYRNALERETLEIPAGCRDSKTEDTAYCAAREMEEETGYRSTNVKHLLSLRTTVAFCDEAVVGFMAVYVALCYLVPGWRLKLHATAWVYFATSLRHMALLKGVFAMAAGLVLATLPFLGMLREPLPEE